MGRGLCLVWPLIFGAALLAQVQTYDAPNLVSIFDGNNLAGWQMMGQRVLLKRVGMPEDVAKGALFLASDDSAYVTGHALVIDGGLTAADPLRDA